MATVRNLKNAPITEAVLDFRVPPKTLRQDGIQKLQEVSEVLRDRYPIPKPRHSKILHFKLSDQETSSQVRDQGLQGYWYYTSEENRICQFRNDGFSYNMLKPYTRWEEFESEALQLWELYVERFQPEQIVRLATRFINHINLEAPEDLADYLTDVPFGVENLPGETTQFLDQATVRDGFGNSARVVVASEDATSTTVTLLADIDVFHDEPIELPIEMSKLKTILSQLRDFKNKIFFSIFTDQTLNAYA